MQQWAAINNRGFAVHCLAEMIPKRLIPHRPTIEEENRLKITLNDKTIQGPFPSTKVESNPVMYIDVPKSFFFNSILYGKFRCTIFVDFLVAAN
jgi:hypothetical protein